MKVEISLKEIMVYILRRWKAIIVFASVIAILVGGYDYFKQMPRNNDNTASGAVSVASVNQATKLSLSIDLTNFIATSADSYHITLARNDFLSKIGDRYLLIAQGARYTEILKDIIPSIYSDAVLHSKINVLSPTTGVIDIIVSGLTDVDSNEVAFEVYDYLLSYTETVSKSITEHALSFVASSSDQISLGVGLKSIESVYGTALVAFLAGMIIAVLFASVLYLVRLPIQIPEQVQRQLGIRYIGGFRKKKFFSVGDMLAGSLRMAGEGEATGLVYSNLKSFIGSHTKILITGSIDEASVKAFADKMALENDEDDVKFITGANINKSASGVNALMDSDAVVLVESIDHSRLKRIKDEKDRIEMSGKDIVGYVLY